MLRRHFTVSLLARRRLNRFIAHRAHNLAYFKTCILGLRAGRVRAVLTGFAIITANNYNGVCSAASGPIITANSNVTVYRHTGTVARGVRFVRFRPAALCGPNRGPGFLVARTVHNFKTVLHLPNNRRFVSGCRPVGSLTPHSIITHTVCHRVAGQKSSFICLSIARGSPSTVHDRFPGVCRGYLSVNVSVAGS